MGNSDKQVMRYYAYYNYFFALQMIIVELYPSPIDLVSNIHSTKGYQRLKKGKNVDDKRIVELLHRGWFTWGLLEEIGENSILAYLNSPWSFVQVYYSLYSLLDAFFLAKGQDMKLSHSAMLNTVASEITNSQSCFPRPWSCTISGNPAEREMLLYEDKLSFSKFTLGNPLKSPSNNPRAHYALFLKATRKKMLETSVAGWKQRNKKKNIPLEQRNILADKLRPTTIFDALYRMRTRSNYRDIDSFAIGMSPFSYKNGDALKLHRSVMLLTDSSLLMLEVLIAKIMGKAWMLDEMKTFATSVNSRTVQDKVLSHFRLLR